MYCKACPRSCNIDRENKRGFCKSPIYPVICRAALHFWEEPCISGKNGSGTIFFKGCSLRCAFCQNYEISRDGEGKICSPERLAEIMRELVLQGAHNINLVNPTHFTYAIKETLKIYKPPVPVVYNSGGYDSVSSLKSLEGLIDVYLPDYKYADEKLSSELSGARDYPAAANEAIREMIRQTGEAVFDEDGMMKRGTLIRHLILPGHVMNTLAVLRKIAELENPIVSIMAQYTPVTKVEGHPELSRKITSAELLRVKKYVEKLNLNGYIQQRESADEGYIPKFNVKGM